MQCVDLGGRRIIKKKNFFQAEDGIRDVERSRGLGDVYKRQGVTGEGITEMLRALLENVESVRHTERAVQDQETLAPEEGDANPKEWSPV